LSVRNSLAAAALAARTGRRRGTAAKVVWISPVAYSVLNVSTPRTLTAITASGYDVLAVTPHPDKRVTARLAASLGRDVGAVPGRVTSPQAEGTNDLLAAGAQVIRGAQDVLDGLFGAGCRAAPTR